MIGLEEIMDYCEKCSLNSLQNENKFAVQTEQQQQHVRRKTNFYALHSKKLLLALSILLLIPTLTSANVSCKHHEYWDVEIDECVPCTKCNRHQIVIRPCQKHLDTVCRPINSIEIDWSKSMATNGHHRVEQLEQQPEAAASTEDQQILLWNWQLIFLTLAILACCLFFFVTIIISINYVRQWRKIKKQFDTDIEQLSQQLMARLAVPPVESSTFFIDDPSMRHSVLGPRQIEVRCVYLEDLLDGKTALKSPYDEKKCNIPIGNMYTDEGNKKKCQNGDAKHF